MIRTHHLFGILLWLIFQFGSCGPASAQLNIPLEKQRYLDSLERLLNGGATDSIKARANFLLSDYWSYTDTLKSREYLERGRKLSQDDPYLEAIYWFYRAGYLFNLDASASETAYMHADSLLRPFSTKEAYRFRARAWHNYGLQQQLKDDEKAFANILTTKNLPLALKTGDSSYIGACYANIGLIFMNLRQHQKSASYYEKALGFLNDSKADSKYLAVISCEMAKNLVYLQQYPEAKAALDKVREILSPYPKAPQWLDYYEPAGMYYNDLKNYKQAIAELDKGIALAGKLEKSYIQSALIFQKYRSLSAKGDYRDAIVLLKDVLEAENIMAQANNRILVYKELSHTYEKLGNMKEAYHWMKQYSSASDSLNASQLKQDVHELEVKFHQAEQEKKITLLEAEKAQASLRAKNNRLINWSLAGACLFLLTMAILSFFYYQNNKKLTRQKEINYQQELKEMEQKQQLIFANAMLQGEERERKRVAKDLHDGLGGMLAGIKMNLSSWAGSKGSTQKDPGLRHITGQLDHSLRELRYIARNLMPEALLKSGLEAALRDLCESIISGNLQVEFQAYHIDRSMALPIQVTIYRIVQEALSNALRHSEARNIMLQCSQNEHTFFITVEDDGKGFEEGKKAGMGLESIRQRLEQLNGTMEIISASGEGTSLTIELNVGG